jgi:aryl-alcohol dehydrogenase-like predicted oxidoreductase
MSHANVSAAIIGARNVTQLKDSLAALDVEITSDLREEISASSPARPRATDRTETLKPNWA